jgi:hypothetical protein
MLRCCYVTLYLDFGSTPVGIVAVPSLNALSHRPLAEEIRARFQATICGICGGQE